MKFLRLLLLLILPGIVNAQKSTYKKPDPAPLKILVDAYLSEHKTSWNLTDADIRNWVISDLYSNEKTGIIYLYVHQQVNNINIFNAVSSVSIKDGKIASFAKRLYADAIGKANSNLPSNSEIFAIQKTAEHLGLKMREEPKIIYTNKSSNKKYYSSPSLSKEKIRVELIYQPVKKTLRLAWNVNVHLIDGSHWWNVRVDAVTGVVLGKNDWTTSCNFDGADPASYTTAASSQDQVPNTANVVNASSVVPSYRVYPLPFESPLSGSSSLISNPSDSIASPFGWHDTNGLTGADYFITRGNNVYAYDDTLDIDSAGFSPSFSLFLTISRHVLASGLFTQFSRREYSNISSAAVQSLIWT